MDSHYHQLCAEERACIMQMTHQGLSLRHIAGRQARQRLRQPRRPRKLQAHSAVFIVVTDLQDDKGAATVAAIEAMGGKASYLHHDH